LQWRVRALAVTKVHSTFFADRNRFPERTIEFDHALVMRDIPHQWHTAEDLYRLQFEIALFYEHGKMSHAQTISFAAA